MMKALIVSDSTKEVEILSKQLNSLNFEPIIIPEYSLDYIKNINFPVLFYRDPYTRIRKEKEIYDFLTNCGFQSVIYNKEIIAANNNFANQLNSFILNENPLHFEKPDVEPADILMVTHNRPEYLKLSLNALLYSLDDPKPKIHILMSDPSPSTVITALDFAEKNKNIILYRSENNVALAGFNLLLQLVLPKVFTIWEDDFIIPQHAKFLMPNWNLRLVKRLDEYDFSALSTSIQNCPWDLYSMYKITDNNKYAYHKWFNNIPNPPIIGTSVTIKTKTYVELARAPFFITGDGTLVENYKYSISSITGYHIGFNQEMDGFRKIGDYARFPEVENKQKVINLNTGETKEFLLDNIKSLF